MNIPIRVQLATAIALRDEAEDNFKRRLGKRETLGYLRRQAEQKVEVLKAQLDLEGGN